MADTQLTLQASRYLNRVFLQGSVSGVSLNALVLETFFLPNGFGKLYIEWCQVIMGTFSGAYVAPAPAYDGPEVAVVSADLSTRVDGIGTERWVNRAFTTTPGLAASFDLHNMVLVRVPERIQVTAPLSAGAGVTGVINIHLRGIRVDTA